MDKQRLKELTSSIKFSELYDAKSHQAIYDHLDKLHSSNASSIPPSLVFYTARNILSPTFIAGQIPDLLNLLTAIETFRRFATLKSDEALEWQKYYECEKSHGREQDVRLLAANEVRTLQRCVFQKDARRREYIVLIRSLILFYIHYLWTSPESCLLAKRLSDFFPGSVQSINMPSQLLFHVDLSEEEKQYFRRLKLECHEWLKLVIDWQERREEACQGEGQSPEEIDEDYADDFCNAFPQPSKPSEMAEIYLNKVEDIVQKLGQWFPPSEE